MECIQKAKYMCEICKKEFDLYEECFYHEFECKGYKHVNPKVYKIYEFENQIFKNNQQPYANDFYIKDGMLYRIPFEEEPFKFQEQLDVATYRKDIRMSYVWIDFQYSKYKTENDVWIDLAENMIKEFEKEKQELDYLKLKLENKLNLLKGNSK